MDFSLTLCGSVEVDPSTGYVKFTVKGIPQEQKDAILAWLEEHIPSCEFNGGMTPPKPPAAKAAAKYGNA